MLTLPREPFKFTPLAQRVAALVPTPPCTNLAMLEACLPTVSGPQLVFHNGILVPQLSQPETLPKSLQFSPQIGQEPLPHPTLDDLDTLPTPPAYLLEALTPTHPTIHIIHLASGTPIATRLHLKLHPNSTLAIVEHHANPVGAVTWHHHTTTIELAATSTLTHTILQHTAPESITTRRTTITSQPHSTYTGQTLHFGASLARAEVHATLTHNTTFTHTGLTLGRAEQLHDTTLRITHIGENNTTHIRQRNLLNDSAHAVFQGKFFVAKEAQKTNAYMHCHNLLLANTARASHKPELEIYADDVKCSHGAATGGLNADQQFYLQARGLTPHAARALLVEGYAREFIEQFPLHLQPTLHQNLQNWLTNTPPETPIDFGSLHGEWLHENPTTPHLRVITSNPQEIPDE